MTTILSVLSTKNSKYLPMIQMMKGQIGYSFIFMLGFVQPTSIFITAKCVRITWLDLQ